MRRLLMRLKQHIILLIVFSLILNVFYGYWRNNSAEVTQVFYPVAVGQRVDALQPEEQNYTIVYPDLLKCHHYYNHHVFNESIRHYAQPSDESLLKARFVRGVLIYYPAERHKWFEQEFKWLYRSWVEMQKHESTLWRTDLIVFMNLKGLSNTTTFDGLDCSVKNLRTSREAKPMCTIIDFVQMNARNLTIKNETLLKSMPTEQIFDKLYRDINVFNDHPQNLWMFYQKLKELDAYKYTDSILIAFEGYSYLKDNFDYLLRSDMDVFLTPLFGKWLPRSCNQFIVGGGGYNNDFNMKRLGRISENLKLKWANVRNLGSTWYATPQQFRLVSYFTLVSMIYISHEEFSEPERKGKVGTLLWPEWHYGVLLLYGQCIAMNHFIESRQFNITQLGKLIDFPSSNKESVFEKVHIHVYHGREIFSKLQFRDKFYDNVTSEYLNGLNKTQVNFYTLNLAVESKRMTPAEQRNLLQTVIQQKN